MMKISFVLDTFGGGGKERRCLQLIQGLNKQGFNEIQVIVVNDDRVAYPELYDTQSELHIIARKNKGLSFIETTKQVNKLIKSFKPDIVQSWGVISTLIPALLKPFYNYKLIGAYVADADKIKRFSLFSLFPLFCDKIVGNSLVGLKAYNVPASKAVLIYNGFNEKRLENLINREKKKKELNISTPYVVSMTASFWSNKDWKCYIKTAKNIVKERKDITFLAIGDGPTFEEHKKMISNAESENIRLLGRRNDVDEILQICDCTVLTSNHGEGISNSIMESMAFGVPVIATNSGGTPEIIKDKENGLLLYENNVNELSDKIEIIIDDNRKRRSYGEKSAATINECFLLEKMTKKYSELYQSL